ncbi:MAG: hypothetical protein U1E65_23735 [Myxococcota bacterium]
MRLLGPVLALALLGAELSASATVVRAMSLEEKTNACPVIVLAEVQSQETHWVRPGGSAETVFTLKVKESLKGDLKVGSTFTLLQAGGRIGEFLHEVPGQSSWKKGEQAVLFLERFERHYVEVGVGIGKYGIEPSAKGPMVTHNPKVAVAVIDRGRPMKVEAAKPMAPTPLPEFLTTVRNLVNHTQHKTLAPRPAIQGQ